MVPSGELLEHPALKTRIIDVRQRYLRADYDVRLPQM